MKICSACGTQQDDRAMVCSKCGQKINAIHQSSPAKQPVSSAGTPIAGRPVGSPQLRDNRPVTPTRQQENQPLKQQTIAPQSQGINKPVSPTPVKPQGNQPVVNRPVQPGLPKK